MFAEARFERPFAALLSAGQEGLRLALPPEQRVQLAALSKPGLSMAEYRALDLPVVIGTLNARQQELFAPNTNLGFFTMRHTSQEVALVEGREELIANRLIRAGFNSEENPKNIVPRDNAGCEDLALLHNVDLVKRMQQKLLQQRSLVSDILRFDRATFGTKFASVGLDFDQDRPGNHYVKATTWHPDKSLAYHSAQFPLTRVYLVRLSAPTEVLRDRLVYDDAGQKSPLLQDIARKHEATPDAYAAWLAQVKAAGMFFQAPAAAVTLLTADKTWHKSHRPQQAAPDSHLRVVVRPIV